MTWTSSSKWRGALLDAADFLWSSLLVAPLVVLFWRGTWDILNEMVYPLDLTKDAFEAENDRRRQLSGIICYLFGLFTRIFLDLGKFHIGEFIAQKPNFLKSLGGLVFTGIYSFSGVSFWRGIWLLMIEDVGEKTTQLTIVLIGSLLVILFSKVARSLISSPLALCLDYHENTFQNTTFFQKTPADKGMFLVDVVFTNLVVRQLIVFCWWSLWSLENEFLKKNKIGVKDNVAVDSVLMGYSAAALSFFMDKLIMKTTTTKLYITKPLQYFATILAFFASVNVWRGVWSMYDNFLFPNVGKELNYLASISVAFIVLALILLTNTVSNDQIAFDTEEGEIISLEYWNRRKSKVDNEEMIPIVE